MKKTAALILGISIASLAGCSGNASNGSFPSAVVPSDAGLSPGGSQHSQSSFTRRLRSAFSYASLYSFAGGADGNGPEAALLNVKGTLYGTTQSGGGPGCYTFGCGTVFEMSTSGAESVLYSFQGGTDGRGPIAPVTNVNGTLYGTTPLGGGSGCYNSTGCGTIFEVFPSGTEQVVHSFQGPPDGARPYAGLIDVNGTLYGTTDQGGSGSCDYVDAKGCGTIFAVSASGVERVLYSFKGGKDVLQPEAGLIDMKGTLYGTTIRGGSSANDGTVFKVDTSGVERVLYSFKGGKDGARPSAGLIDVKGTLYGTTSVGGGSGCYTSGCGTVFDVSTSGVEHVLHRFKSGATDGANPLGLTNLNGTLYGTTYGGGHLGPCYGSKSSCGTIFDISTSGVEHVLYRLQGGTDGANPSARLVQVGSMLYGTTIGGGTSADGTVFRVTP